MKNILVVCPDFYPIVGGYANASHNFVKSLSQSGRARVTVVTWVPLKKARELDYENVVVRRFHRLPEFRYSIILDQVRLGIWLRRFITRGHFDFTLFETFESPISLAIAVWRSRHLPRMAVRIHGSTETEIFRYSKSLMNRLNRRIQKRVSLWLKNVFSTTPFYKHFFVRAILEGDLLSSFKNYHVIPNCVYVNPVTRARAADREGIFLCLGRFDTFGYNQKNFELVAHALRLLKDRHPGAYEKCKVYFVGSGERKTDLTWILDELGVRERCELLDAMENTAVHALQATASACILVSRYEGLSMFALEALANGAPLIVSRGTGASELVVEGENGYLVDPDDPFALADTMARFTAADIEAMARASRQRFERHYRPEIVAEKFLSSVELCLASRK